MIHEYPAYCDEFACSGSRCPDTCCQGWEIDIDDDTLQIYQSLPGALGEQVRAAITAAPDGSRCIAPGPDGRCPLLTAEGLCSLITGAGPGALSTVCDEYPRYYICHGDYEQVDMSLSCPEVARLFFAEQGPIRYQAIRDERPGEPISAQELAALREVLAERDELIELFADPQMTPAEKEEAILESCPGVHPLPDEKLLALLDTLEVLDARWSRILARMHTCTSPARHLLWDLSDVYARLGSYFAFRYYIDTLTDGSSDPAVLLILQSLRVLDLMLQASPDAPTPEVLADLAHIFSRQIEHSEENVRALKGETD